MALLRVVRASTIEASSLSRPRGIVETDGDVCDRALDTVDHFGHRVITGEVASHASLQIDKRIKRSRLSRPIAGLLEVCLFYCPLTYFLAAQYLVLPTASTPMPVSTNDDEPYFGTG